MQVTKRDGRTEAYDRQKIARAMGKALAETGDPVASDASALEALLSRVEQALVATGATEVEQIQDLVERTLMETGHYDAAKAYILYRHRRAELRATRRAICALALAETAGTGASQPAGASDAARDLDAVLAKISRDFDSATYPLSALAAKFQGFAKPSMSAGDRENALVRAAVELTTPEAPAWGLIAGRLLSFVAQRRLAKEEQARGLTCLYDKILYDKIRYLTDQGLYGSYILENYSREEIGQAASWLDRTRDELLDYPGLDLLLKRYVICSHDHVPLESPQEMFMGIALHLALRERPEARMEWVRRFYDMLSQLEVTMATPTMSNARKPHHQLSSCFIDTVPDSLEGIYRSVDNFAMVSKFGGGMGMYLGKVRAKGGSIRGFEGAAGGVVRWIRVINDTAVAVDQLGVRAGAVAVYLDAWHRDLPEFLQLRTNNGDDRMKALAPHVPSRHPHGKGLRAGGLLW